MICPQSLTDVAALTGSASAFIVPRSMSKSLPNALGSEGSAASGIEVEITTDRHREKRVRHHAGQITPPHHVIAITDSRSGAIPTAQARILECAQVGQ